MKNCLLVLLFQCALIVAEEPLTIELGGKKCIIENPSNPSDEDYQAMQNFLQDTLEFRIKDINDPPRRGRLKNFRLYNPAFNISPYFNIEKFGAEDSTDAVICYCSYNESYFFKFERLMKHLRRVNFHGHVLYNVGGWPNIEGGCLTHFVNPYMFKPCAFMEAKRLGYKRVMWIDLSLIPLKNLKPLFNYISQHDTIFRLHHDSFWAFNDLFPKLFQAMKMTDQEKRQQIQIDSKVFGINLESKRMCDFLDSWHQHGIDGYFFLSSMPEEFPMSILLNRMGIFHPPQNMQLLKEVLAWDLPVTNPDSFFLIRYQIDDPLR